MDIVSWNVNSLRARMERVLDFLDRKRPDVVCLQETKVADDMFPLELLEDAGYQCHFFGQRTYNGVAILSRIGIEDVVCGFGDDEWDEERRVIGATVGDVMLLNLYVVNGKSVGTESYERKLRWMARLREFVLERYPMDEKVVLCGDFNCTFDDRDVYDPDAWRGRILCSDGERGALAELMDLGFSDALRRFHEESGFYTWWDYRTRGFERGNRGLRIDHFLMSPAALEVCSGVVIETDERAGVKPSDHAPIVATLD